MSRILIVDDEYRIRDIIKKYALFSGYEVAEAIDGLQAISMSMTEHFDLIIMDIMMPELDGFSACKEIRRRSNVPIIVLSAKGEEYDRIHGFELNVDDYVVKPFSPKELMMRISAILKRSTGEDGKHHDVFEYNDLKIDFDGRVVTVNDDKIGLTPKEYDLLFYLVKNKGVALSRQRILNDVWDTGLFEDNRTLDTHIKFLRKNLGIYGKCIVTIRGVGYRFEV